MEFLIIFLEECEMKGNISIFLCNYLNIYIYISSYINDINDIPLIMIFLAFYIEKYFYYLPHNLAMNKIFCLFNSSE